MIFELIEKVWRQLTGQSDDGVRFVGRGGGGGGAPRFFGSEGNEGSGGGNRGSPRPGPAAHGGSKRETTAQRPAM
jgi:hypothetical protein